MKFAVHSMQHIPFALKLYGPLHLVSCYRPENEIGKISRRICGTNNTTKEIMSTFQVVSECRKFVVDILSKDSKKSQIVIDVASRILNVSASISSSGSRGEACHLKGKPERLTNENIIQQVQKALHDDLICSSRFFTFDRCETEVGIHIRASDARTICQRNESLVQDRRGRMWRVENVVAVLDAENKSVINTFFYGELLTVKELSLSKYDVKHILTVRQSNLMFLKPTRILMKQLVILAQKPLKKEFIVSPPSSIFLTT